MVRLIVLIVALWIIIDAGIEWLEYNKGKCRKCGADLTRMMKHCKNNQVHICKQCGNMVFLTYKFIVPRQKGSENNG